MSTLAGQTFADIYPKLLQNPSGNIIELSDGTALSTINAATMLQIGGADIFSDPPINWTPAIASQSGSFSTLTYNIQTGKAWYIGTNLLFLSFDIRTSEVSVGTASGYLHITGSPETLIGTLPIINTTGFTPDWAGTAPQILNPVSGGLLRLYTTGAAAITVSDMTTGVASANRIKGNILCAF